MSSSLDETEPPAALLLLLLLLIIAVVVGVPAVSVSLQFNLQLIHR